MDKCIVGVLVTILEAAYFVKGIKKTASSATRPNAIICKVFN